MKLAWAELGSSTIFSPLAQRKLKSLLLPPDGNSTETRVASRIGTADMVFSFRALKVL